MFSPFIAPKKARVGRKFPNSKEYVSYRIVESVNESFDPKNPEEFTIDQKVVVDQRIPIKEELNSYRSKVGLKNLLKGITTKKQMEDFIVKTSSNGEFVDLTKMPKNFDEFVDISKSVDRIYESLPKELRGSLTKEEFMKTLTKEKLSQYYQSVAKKIKDSELAKKKKEGDE